MTPPNKIFLEIFFVPRSKFIYKTFYQFNKKNFFFAHRGVTIMHGNTLIHLEMDERKRKMNFKHVR